MLVLTIFNYFKIFNYKIYLITNTLILILLIFTGLISVWNQNFSLNTIMFYIFTFGGLLAVSALVSYEMRYASLIQEFITLTSKGEFKKAEELIDILLKSHFKDEISRFFKSVNLNCFGKTSEALELLNELLEENLRNDFEVQVMHYKFSILLHFRSYKETEDFLDIVLEEYPTDQLILLDDADLDSKLGFKEDAEESYKNLLPLVDERLQKFRKSIIAKVRLPETYWNQQLSSILFEKYKIHCGLQEYENALECINELLELNLDIDLLNSKSFLLAKLGQYKEALKDIDKALELNSEFFETLKNKGYLLYKSGKPEYALKCFQQAIQINPKYIAAYYYKGQTHEDLKQYNEALECYDKVLELNQDCELAENAKNRLKEIID
jgi:tetratricopeptide (TPR) repeat protein